MKAFSAALARRLGAGKAPAPQPGDHEAEAAGATTPAAPSEGTASSSEGPAAVSCPAPADFSALELRDRVVIMLLFDQIVSEERVAEVWALWQQEYGGDHQQPLWRLLTLVPDLDRELIFAEAARVYGIEEARIVRLGALHIIEKMHRLIPKHVWDEMVKLRMVPVDEAEQQHSHRTRLIFATHDPTHPAIQALMPQLGLAGYELRYASEMEVVDLLAEAFPWKYQGLKQALEAERALIAHTTARIIQDAPDEEPSVDEAPAAAPKDDPPGTPGNSSSILHLFEDILIETVRQKAQGACIVPNEAGKAEIYFQHDEAPTQWHLAHDVDANALLATIKSVVIRADFSVRAETQQEVIKRWIDGKLVRFRISALPSSEKLNLESIVIRALQ